MSKEIIFVTQTGVTGWIAEEKDKEELKKEIKDKTGKDAIILGPGMNVETVIFTDTD